jgi:hypothetical protein
MSESTLTTAGPSSPAKPIPADGLLSEFAESLDVAALQQRHPEWDRERLCALLKTAAEHLTPDERPAVYQRMGSLLPIVATFLAGHLLLLFARHMKGAFDSFETPVPLITRLALDAANLKSDPVKVLCGAMLVICFGWAWWSRKRLRRFSSWACILAIALGLSYLLVCLYPLILHYGERLRY